MYDRNALIEQHLGIARKLASALGSKYPLEYEDLVGEAYLALTQAAAAFDQRKGVRFTTYAYSYVRGKLLHYIRARRGAGCPRAHEQFPRISAQIEQLTHELGREPSRAEIFALDHSYEQTLAILQRSETTSLFGTADGYPLPEPKANTPDPADLVALHYDLVLPLRRQLEQLDLEDLEILTDWTDRYRTPDSLHKRRRRNAIVRRLRRRLSGLHAA